MSAEPETTVAPQVSEVAVPQTEAPQADTPQAQPPQTSEPAEAVKLFVGQVSNATTEQKLREIFSQFGTVSDVVILTDRMTGRRKGCGFVTMASKAEGDVAIAGTNDKIKLDGARREIIVRYAQRNFSQQQEQKEHKLYMGMLSRSSTEDDIRAIISPFGTITEVFIMKDPSGQSKGCAFVKMTTRESCEAAIAAVDGKMTDKDASGPVQCRFALTKPKPAPMMYRQPYQQQAMGTYGGYGQQQQQQAYNAYPYPPPPANPYQPQNPYAQNPYAQTPQNPYAQNPYAQPQWGGYQVPAMPTTQSTTTRQQYGPAGANLFIFNVPDGYSDSDLSSLFGNFGVIVSSNVQRDMKTGNSKGFGFVSFDNPASAQAAIKALDGFVIGHKKLSVRLKKSSGGGGGNSRGFSPY